MTDRDDTQPPRDYEPQETGGFAGGARKRAIEAYDNARDGVAQAGRRAGDAIDEAPLIAIAGGLAAGALIAALLPRTRTESQLLRPVGDKLTGTAKAAVDAAKDAGSTKLDELGLTRERGVETIREILQGAGDAARASAQAAFGSVKDRG